MGEIDLMRERAIAYTAGRSLERMFYTSPAVYERDIVKVWCESWLWAGHVSQIPNPGDYFLFTFGTESVIILRDGDGEVRAHLNVCRHRGSRVCLESSGNARVFSCPYHGWTYGLNGALRGARMMGEDFDAETHSLGRVNITIFEGLIFLNLSENPPDLAPALARLKPHVAPFGLESAKVAHTKSYPVPANWKLALENYLECYHCAPSHKEYSRSHSLKDPASMTEELVGAMREKARAAGLTTEVVNASGLDAQPLGADIYHRRYPLYSGYDTGSRDGGGLAPLLGDLTGYDGGATDITIGPVNHFLAYSDHVVGYRFLPRGPRETEIQTVWIVRQDAVEGRDYQLGALIWLWDVTTKDDERIIRNNQAGVDSIRYRPGPLSSMEWGISAFLSWYARQVG
ncbi:MAG TPA: aromatic ring-hydroxylating dioxygenase subunit alpha [Thermohalobaculum sp.]|nr:aromatic ring-hydroxylating dioxygenase subunit alpha [Thermohalobaculum sp.]